ncbi:MAG TPA: Asp-tRNA(Asn)/Glu-tRNA(Gln) amidotransferase subunit GatA [Candidatus Magasanikbacteria bacterium]|nr:Asp-tRNA(Asn)/Glu-tRNA(Gln) amidotransferase subunit GatA [Candidatus Magasanikbacteria bacterium]
MMLNNLTIREAYEGLKKKKFTSVELTQACLDRIEERNSELNAFITVFAESALHEAHEADEMIARGEQKMLTGIPFAVKDAISTRDGRSTASAKILDNYVSAFDATVIGRIRAEGAVLIGKNNCDAFGHGASNENSMYGAVRNPHDLNKVSGGSSGGTAAAVADNMCIFGIGEDTGGSIRQPAAFCGIVGLRPSYGRNSRYGIMPMASSLDTVGPMTKTVEDTAILMQIMAGQDVLDATTVTDGVPDYVKGLKLRKTQPSLRGSFGGRGKIRIGVPKEYFEVEGMEDEVKQIIEEKIEEIKRPVLRSSGATEGKLKDCEIEIVSVSLPMTKYAIPVYYIVVPSEDSSNLGRMDGIRYGVRVGGKDLYETYSRSRAQGFPEEVKRRIMIGTYALSAGYYDAYYRKAQKVRTLIIRDFEKVFTEVDLLLTPTTPTAAFGVGEKKDDVLAMYLADVFAAPPAIAGLPAISIPVGNTSAGLPVGMQIIGPRMQEELVLRTAYSIFGK